MNGQASNDTIQAATQRLRAAFDAVHPDESEIRNAVCAFVDVVKPLGSMVETITWCIDHYFWTSRKQ